ncbi:MAG: PAS domain S-box protein [Rhizobiales bacterium]|nr:PAS domain S-box protein [Hyphomicrobiales bacterium]
MSAKPAWVWSAEGTRILWANAVGCAIFGTETPAALTQRRFDKERAGVQIKRLSESLKADNAMRLERLRGFGAGFGRALVCACSRIVYDGQPAILVAAAETAGPSLAPRTRAQRLLEDCDDAIAIYSSDGTLLHASPMAAAKLAGASTLADINAEALAASALANGNSKGVSDIGAIAIERSGTDLDTALVIIIETEARTAMAAQPDRSPGTTAADPALERRHPLRFVWQMDAEGRLMLDSDEFADFVGQHAVAMRNRPWNEIATELKLDPEGKVARAIATQKTWSGITIAWPIDETSEPLMIELSGLPVFDRDRVFRGYRGFGVCRDIARLSVLARERRSALPPKEAPRPVPYVVSSNDQTDDERPSDQAMNVVPFRSAAVTEVKSGRLNDIERRAFREIGRELTARLKGIEDLQSGAAMAMVTELDEEPVAGSPITTRTTSTRPKARHDRPAENDSAERADAARALLNRLPVGVLVYRLDQLLYANPAFLEWTGYDTIRAFGEAGGLDTLFVESESDVTAQANDVAKLLTISTPHDGKLPVEGRLLSIPWEGESALALMFTGAPADSERKASEIALRLIEAENRELKAILDAATDGVILLDADGRILASNRSAEILFGRDAHELIGNAFGELFTPESRPTAIEYLERMRQKGAASAFNDGREVVGRVGRSGLISLFATIGCLSEGQQKFCAVFRDITAWKKTEGELLHAKSEAERISAKKSEFLAKISHEIRTPLNTIIGFSEVMIGERFGSIGNERYIEYLKDVHASGGHLVSLIDDLLDLSKIEAGKLDLTFTGIDLNDIARQCVAQMQPQANRERIIIRTSLSPALPQVMADARSLSQIMLNLLSNSIKFTGAGGQVIVSTATGDDGQVMMRVRDTGTGMSEKDLQTALEPFRQLATAARWGASGTGLGLPLTKALTEANRATFNIRSALEAGTLVEIAFPAARVLAAE